MSIVAIQAGLGKLPVAHLQSSLSEFLAPLTALLPDKRLREVALYQTWLTLSFGGMAPFPHSFGEVAIKDELITSFISLVGDMPRKSPLSEPNKGGQHL